MEALALVGRMHSRAKVYEPGTVCLVLSDEEWDELLHLAEIGAAMKSGPRLGGKARAAKLSPKRRSEIAKKAARARWNKRTS